MKDLMYYRLNEGNYQTYDELAKTSFNRNKSMEEIKASKMEVVKGLIGRFFPSTIEPDSIEDQSTEKGIKFLVKKGKDLIHLYFTKRNALEVYLNKKRSTEYAIYNHLQDTYMSTVEIAVIKMGGYDHYVEYIDNGTQYAEAKRRNSEILDYFNKLSASDKKKAIEQLKKLNPKNDRIDKVFNV